MDDKRRAKKFLHDYAIAIATTILLIVILGLLVLARHNALASISNLSKINPLITSGQNKLVVASNSSEIVKVPKDDETQGQSAEQNNQTDTQKNSGIVQKDGGATGTGSATSGGTSHKPDDGTTSSPGITQSFAAHVVDGLIAGSMKSQCSLIGLAGLCIGTWQYTYTISATIAGSNGPGSVSYSWSAKPSSGSTVSSTGSFQAGSGATTSPISIHWTTGSCASYDITLTLIQPTNSQKSIATSYSPSC